MCTLINTHTCLSLSLHSHFFTSSFLLLSHFFLVDKLNRNFPVVLGGNNISLKQACGNISF